MKGEKPVSTKLPTEDLGYETYKAAGKLSQKRAIITGGDSGIGRAVAILFAMEGATSFLVYLPEEEEDAQETRKMVRRHGGECGLMQADVRKKETCRAIVEEGIKYLGGIDILVNNTAYQNMVHDINDLDEYVSSQPLLPSLSEQALNCISHTPREQWERTFDTNIHPFFYLSKYTLPHMKTGSTIINCASVNPYIGRSDLLDYTSTKGAIVAFTRALSNQQVKNGIRVNCVCPGPGILELLTHRPFFR
jgi:NAD(P)-dependent dehydrogenase (short-subunit alcohol dehydrogenase family)